jgi:hypothetical protein
MVVSHTFFPGCPGTTVFLILASWVARITGMNHRCWLHNFKGISDSQKANCPLSCVQNWAVKKSLRAKMFFFISFKSTRMVKKKKKKRQPIEWGKNCTQFCMSQVEMILQEWQMSITWSN